jgi:hypothetical protein
LHRVIQGCGSVRRATFIEVPEEQHYQLPALHPKRVTFDEPEMKPRHEAARLRLVSPAVKAREAGRRRTQPAEIRGTGRAGSQEWLKCLATKPPVPTGSREVLDATLIGPPAQRPRIDPDEPACRPHGQPVDRATQARHRGQLLTLPETMQS